MDHKKSNRKGHKRRNRKGHKTCNRKLYLKCNKKNIKKNNKKSPKSKGTINLKQFHKKMEKNGKIIIGQEDLLTMQKKDKKIITIFLK